MPIENSLERIEAALKEGALITYERSSQRKLFTDGLQDISDIYEAVPKRNTKGLDGMWRNQMVKLLQSITARKNDGE